MSTIEALYDFIFDKGYANNDTPTMCIILYVLFVIIKGNRLDGFMQALTLCKQL